MRDLLQEEMKECTFTPRVDNISEALADYKGNLPEIRVFDSTP